MRQRQAISGQAVSTGGYHISLLEDRLQSYSSHPWLLEQPLPCIGEAIEPHLGSKCVFQHQLASLRRKHRAKAYSSPSTELWYKKGTRVPSQGKECRGLQAQKGARNHRHQRMAPLVMTHEFSLQCYQDMFSLDDADNSTSDVVHSFAN